jgi:hypothetical protein
MEQTLFGSAMTGAYNRKAINTRIKWVMKKKYSLEPDIPDDV